MNGYGTDRPAFLRHVARWLRARLDRRRESDGLLQSAATWEAQYAAGRWDYLAGLSELSRFSVLAGYVWHLRPGGAVLDVGCGQGTLLSRLPPSAYSRYVGVDISPSAISAAQKLQNERSTFLAADCEQFAPPEQFDVIIFNEVLSVLREPERTLERYSHALRDGGLILVSTCTTARGGRAMLGQLKRTFSTVDETRLIHHGTGLSWTCTALRPRTDPTGGAGEASPSSRIDGP